MNENTLMGPVNGDSEITPESLQAINMMRTGKIPPEAIKQHPGKGNKIFSYVSHVFLTRALNEAFGQFWSTNILETKLYDDNSAAVVMSLHIDFPSRDGKSFYRRTITEVGSHDVPSGMAKA